MSELTLRSRYILAGGVRTHFTQAGDDGPPLVLLHGGSPGNAGGLNFGRLMPLLSERFRVHALDSVGGFGFTDQHAPAPHGLQSRVDHLEDFADTLCMDRLYLAGNSQGAWVAARYALLHPDRVEKLCLMGSNTVAQAMGIPAPMTDGMLAIRGYDGTREGIRPMMETIFYHKELMTEEALDQRFASIQRPGTLEAFGAFREAWQHFITDPGLSLNYDMRHTLPKLSVPTIFIWGKEDAFAPVTLGYELEPLLPNVRFHWIEEAGHAVFSDQPEQVGRIMLDFFAG